MFTGAVCFVSALREKSVVCNRGKGDTPRLGHSVDEHVRHPKQVAALAGLNVIDLAVGNMHCLAITDDGQYC